MAVFRRIRAVLLLLVVVLAAVMITPVTASADAGPPPACVRGAAGYRLESGHPCTLATKQVPAGRPYALNAAAVVSANDPSSDSYRAVLTANIVCRVGGKAVFNVGGIRNIWRGLSAGVYPRGVLAAQSGIATCTLEATQNYTAGFAASNYYVPSPYITPTPASFAAWTAGPNYAAPDVRAAWPEPTYQLLSTKSMQVRRMQWTPSSVGGTVNVMAQTNLTSCHWKSDADPDKAGVPRPCGGLPLDQKGNSVAVVKLSAWQPFSPTDTAQCNAATPVTTNVVIDAKLHHVTLPQILTLPMSTTKGCEQIVVVKTEAYALGDVTSYVSSVQTLVAAWKP